MIYKIFFRGVFVCILSFNLPIFRAIIRVIQLTMSHGACSAGPPMAAVLDSDTSDSGSSVSGLEDRDDLDGLFDEDDDGDWFGGFGAAKMPVLEWSQQQYARPNCHP